MRIAYFNAAFRFGQDGVTRVLYNVFDAALRRGHEVIAFGSDVPPKKDRPVPMVRVPSVTFPLQKAYRMALPGYSHFAKKLHAWRPDIIHINSPCTLGFAAARYARDHGTPAVATYHTHFPTYLRYYNLTRFEARTWKLLRHLYNSLDATFVPSIPVMEELREHQIRRTEYLPNGVDLSMFSPAHKLLRWRTQIGAGHAPVVLFVSRLVWEKNLRVLADAYALLRGRKEKFSMVVVGDGHARRDLERLMPGAIFLGALGGEELSRAYASSDIFVFPSVTETFGLVTLEAMASGLVPVAARAGGAVGIIEEGKSGLFAEPDDAASLADQVTRLLANPAKRSSIAATAVKRAIDFGWEPVMKRMFRRYEEILYESPTPRTWIPD